MFLMLLSWFEITSSLSPGGWQSIPGWRLFKSFAAFTELHRVATTVVEFDEQFSTLTMSILTQFHSFMIIEDCFKVIRCSSPLLRLNNNRMENFPTTPRCFLNRTKTKMAITSASSAKKQTAIAIATVRKSPLKLRILRFLAEVLLHILSKYLFSIMLTLPFVFISMTTLLTSSSQGEPLGTANATPCV